MFFYKINGLINIWLMSTEKLNKERQPLALRVKDVLIALMTRFWNETETPNHVAKTKKRGGNLKEMNLKSTMKNLKSE